MFEWAHLDIATALPAWSAAFTPLRLSQAHRGIFSPVLAGPRNGLKAALRPLRNDGLREG
jgi:hypothetical protein